MKMAQGKRAREVENEGEREKMVANFDSGKNLFPKEN